MDRRDLFNLSPFSNPPWGGSTWTYVKSPGGVQRAGLVREPKRSSPDDYPPGMNGVQSTWQDGKVATTPYFRATPPSNDGVAEMCAQLPPPYIIPIQYERSEQPKRWNTPEGPVTSVTRPPGHGVGIIPPGYNYKRHNPGGYKFNVYEYTAQTTGGKPIYPPGRGWYEYANTGRLPGNTIY